MTRVVEHLQSRFERLGRHRFCEVVVESRFLRAPLVLALAPTGHGDQQCVPPPCRRANVLRQGLAVQVGEADIEQRGMRPEAARQVQCLAPRVGRLHMMT